MYHLSIKPISRSDGRTATAAAAYRSAELIIDERTGEVHDYTAKGDVVHSELVLPAGAPAWAGDRAALWNAAEAAEKRKDARVARDYEVAIPKELTREQGIELVRDFAQSLVDRYGVAIDFNIHRDDLRAWDGSEKGWQGYHAHVLASTRKLGREGFGDKAAIELSDAKRKSLGMDNGAAEIEQIRRLWEVAANRHLERAGVAMRIDRRSLKDQGIDRDPTVHLGPGVVALERDGKPSRLGDLNRQVEVEGRERAESKRASRALGDAIEKLETPVEAKPAKPKPERPSRAQMLPQVDLSGLEAFAKEQEAWRQRQAEQKQQQADQERAEREREQAKVQARAEIELRTRERDRRVQRVLAKAELRQARREAALQRLAEKRPEPPRGFLATFKEKAHQQAVATWDHARVVAWRLVQEAKQLAQRLRDIARPERVKEWAHAFVRQTWLQAAVSQRPEQSVRASPAVPEIPGRPERKVGGPAANAADGGAEGGARARGGQRLSLARSGENQTSDPPGEAADWPGLECHGQANRRRP